jgi:stage II sporulation protein R
MERIDMKPQNIQKNTWLVLTVLLLLIVLSNLEYHEPVTNNSLIRIHVLANSNSEADQTLKLQVKDAVIGCLKPLLKILLRWKKAARLSVPAFRN